MSNLQKKVLMVRGKHGVHRQTYYVANEAPNPSLGKRSQGDTVSPQERTKISYAMIWGGKANAGVNHAVDAISKLHGVPSNINPVKVDVRGGMGWTNGLYYFGGPPTIHVNKHTSTPASTYAHEYGHYLDYQLFGTGQGGLHSGATAMRSKEIAPLMKAIYKSQAAKDLAKKYKESVRIGDDRAKGNCEYLLMAPELFARSYAQWVGLRASKQIHRETKAYGDHWREYGYAAQWHDKDFEPIAKEFDRLFARRGLLRQGSGQ